MQSREILKSIGQGLSCVGRRICDVFGAVNPDVWREFMFVSMSAYSLLLPKREQVTAKQADEFPPLVLVHGLGANRGTWSLLKMFLRVNGHKRVYSFGYEKGTIPEFAADLKKFIEEVLQATGESQVDIVAHSLGGIVSRYCIQRLGMADRIRTLITLASPHGGTYAAQYANTDLTVPLRPDSELIRDLNQEDMSQYGVRFITVYSDRDIYVVPAEKMTHEAARNLFVPGISHSQYLVSPRVFKVVESCLTPT